MNKNIYIENHQEILDIYKQSGVNGVDNHLDIFDQRHGLKHNDRLRAEYMQHIGLPLSVEYRKLLED